MKAIISVSECAAVRAGLNQSGDIIIEYDPADLSQEQREEMALSTTRKIDRIDYLHANPLVTGYSNYGGGVVSRADIDSLRYLLDLRILGRASIAEENRKKIDRKIGNFMNAETQALIKTVLRDKMGSNYYGTINTILPDTTIAYDEYHEADRLSDETRAEYPGVNERLELINEEAEALIPRIKEQYAKDQAEEAERQRLATEEDAAKEAEKKAEAEAEENERRAWIQANGSDRLKLMIDAGYEYRKTYEEERISLEFPGYYIMLDKGSRKERANPSLEALKELKRLTDLGITAEISWITDIIEEEDDDYGREKREEKYEAVVVDVPWCRKFLCKRIG